MLWKKRVTYARTQYRRTCVFCEIIHTLFSSASPLLQITVWVSTSFRNPAYLLFSSGRPDSISTVPCRVMCALLCEPAIIVPHDDSTLIIINYRAGQKRRELCKCANGENLYKYLLYSRFGRKARRLYHPERIRRFRFTVITTHYGSSRKPYITLCRHFSREYQHSPMISMVSYKNMITNNRERESPKDRIPRLYINHRQLLRSPDQRPLDLLEANTGGGRVTELIAIKITFTSSNDRSGQKTPI